MNDLFDAFKRLFTGYDPENNAKDKQIQENLREADRRVKENKEKNGGRYVPPVDHLIPGSSSSSETKANTILAVVGALIVILILRD
jgi:preprotein translocase subunit SecF